jgi:hypothetical protein
VRLGPQLDVDGRDERPAFCRRGRENEVLAGEREDLHGLRVALDDNDRLDADSGIER